MVQICLKPETLNQQNNFFCLPVNYIIFAVNVGNKEKPMTMKTYKIILFFVLAISFSCKEEKPKPILQENTRTASVKHYICANKCKNSGSDVQGACPVCKNPYLHNDAYHAQDLLKNGPLNVPANIQAPAANTPAAPSPAQNAKGIYHYTCNKGCYGGLGTASNCTNCGEPLAHNQAYHN